MFRANPNNLLTNGWEVYWSLISYLGKHWSNFKIIRTWNIIIFISWIKWKYKRLGFEYFGKLFGFRFGFDVLRDGKYFEFWNIKNKFYQLRLKHFQKLILKYGCIIFQWNKIAYWKWKINILNMIIL